MNFLQDSKGNWSSIRLINILTIIALIFNWTWSTVMFGAFLPSGELTALILGIIFGKVWQKKVEEKNQL